MERARTRRSWIAGVSLVAVTAALTGCRSPGYAERGAATGGIVGGLTGAMVGHGSGRAPEAALVGGAIGSVVGAAVGDSIDQDIARQKAISARQAIARYAPSPVTSADVVAMVRSGVGEDVIIQHIRTHRLQSPLSASDIVALHQQGVSDRILNAMQEAQVSQVARVPQSGQGPPAVIVHEHVPVPLYEIPACYRHYHRPRRRVRWGLSIYR